MPGFEPSLCVDIDADDPVLLYHIPQAESNANKILGYKDEATPSPQPVADY